MEPMPSTSAGKETATDALLVEVAIILHVGPWGRTISNTIRLGVQEGSDIKTLKEMLKTNHNVKKIVAIRDVPDGENLIEGHILRRGTYLVQISEESSSPSSNEDNDNDSDDVSSLPTDSTSPGAGTSSTSGIDSVPNQNLNPYQRLPAADDSSKDEVRHHTVPPQIYQPHKYTNDDDREMNKYLMELQDRPLIIRTSRPFRQFKNPPQPHMCIRDHTIDGDELFINVMSWTRIVMPQNSDDPIPLYGGMKVLPGSPRSPPLVYAVMANPDFLKHVGRNCPDLEEKRVLIELMCDFVEAMNPGLKLAREAEVLKDRDLSGELKDIWGAVQAQHEREKDGPGTDTTAAPSYGNYLAAQKEVTYIEFGPDFAAEQAAQVAQQNESPYQTQQSTHQIQQPIPNDESSNDLNKSSPSSAINVTNKSINGKSSKDKVNSNDKEVEDKLDGAERSKEILSEVQTNADSKPVKPIEAEAITTTPNKKTKSGSDAASPLKTPTPLNANTSSTTVNNPVTPPTSMKKEKLGGFLPNGCHNIFPFIKSKNNHSKKDGKEKKMKNVIDFVSNSKIEISNKMQTENESGFKDDANVEKMQKIKL